MQGKSRWRTLSAGRQRQLQEEPIPPAPGPEHPCPDARTAYLCQSGHALAQVAMALPKTILICYSFIRWQQPRNGKIMDLARRPRGTLHHWTLSDAFSQEAHGFDPLPPRLLGMVRGLNVCWHS